MSLFQLDTTRDLSFRAENYPWMMDAPPGAADGRKRSTGRCAIPTTRSVRGLASQAAATDFKGDRSLASAPDVSAWRSGYGCGGRGFAGVCGQPGQRPDDAHGLHGLFSPCAL